MSINFPINITHIKQFYVFLLILSNFLVASLAKTKNHELWERFMERFLEKGNSMKWFKNIGTANRLTDLHCGDTLYSSKLQATAIVTDVKYINGHLHYVLEFNRGKSEPIKKLVSPSGLLLQDYKIS